MQGFLVLAGSFHDDAGDYSDGTYEEILVLDGVFEDEHGTYPKGSWLRSPHLSAHNPFTGPEAR